MRYTLVMDSREYPISSIQQLMGYLDALQAYAYGSVTLYQKADKPPKWYENFIYRAVNLMPPTDQSHLAVLTNKEKGVAFLTFVDDKDHTYYSANTNDKDIAREKIVFLLDNGERESCDLRECVKIETAVNALISFLKTGRKPNLVSWRRFKE